MNREFHIKTFVTDLEDPEPGSEIGSDSPSSGDDTKTITEPSPKKSKKGVQKRVVSVPIGDVEGSKSKGETYPPSDSWAWRKYGQKPIKGSPYPRGYYRCSSSKGCPARKQVERSRVDPTTLVITYACDHNHPVPTKTHNSTTSATGVVAGAIAVATLSADEVPAKFAPEKELAVFASQPELELSDDSVALLDQHGQHHRHHWFDDVASMAVLESPICTGSSACVDADVAVLFGEKDDEESLFSDLGELPECSVVFRRRNRIGVVA